MPHKSNAPELQLKIVQRNYESISKLMHGKQQEFDKVTSPTPVHRTARSADVTRACAYLQLTLELDGARSQLGDAAAAQQQVLARAGNAEMRVKVQSLCTLFSGVLVAAA